MLRGQDSDTAPMRRTCREAFAQIRYARALVKLQRGDGALVTSFSREQLTMIRPCSGFNGFMVRAPPEGRGRANSVQQVRR